MRQRILLKRAAVASGLILLPATALSAAIVEGQVVQVRERARVENGGERHELTVRTREGEQVRLALGAAGICDGCVQVGDRVVACTMSRAGNAGTMQVRTMAVERTRTEYRFARRNGDPIATRSRAWAPALENPDRLRDQDRVRDRDRLRDHAPLRDRDRVRQRDRVHDPGTGRSRPGGRGGRG